MKTWKRVLENGVIESVAPEKWRWSAYFDDGSVLKQFDDNGVFHSIKELEGRDVNLFVMESKTEGRIKLAIPTGAKVIHKYVWTRLAKDSEFLQNYVFGWQVGELGRFLKITPEEHLLIMDSPEG